MPQDIGFQFTVPFRVSPDLDRARRRNLDWVRAHGLVTTDQALSRYVSWEMAKVAAYMYPYATGCDLDLAADLMGFWFCFDDQFDGPTGREPAAAGRICADMISIVHQPEASLPADSPPVATTFADVWRRSIDGMSPAWRARAAHNWEYYFGCYPNEAIARLAGGVPERLTYLHLRRGSSGGETTADMIEHLGHFEVPAIAFHSPVLRSMRRIATDVLAFCNDVHSVEKEQARGDIDNLVLVVQQELKCRLTDAIGAVQTLINQRLEKFARLQDQIPQLTGRLGLIGKNREAVDRYVEAMALSMSGYHHWAIETARYAPDRVIPVGQPGYPENLLERVPVPRTESTPM